MTEVFVISGENLRRFFEEQQKLTLWSSGLINCNYLLSHYGIVLGPQRGARQDSAASKELQSKQSLPHSPVFSLAYSSHFTNTLSLSQLLGLVGKLSFSAETTFSGTCFYAKKVKKDREPGNTQSDLLCLQRLVDKLWRGRGGNVREVNLIVF